MESSIAEFLSRQFACERLPTNALLTQCVLGSAFSPLLILAGCAFAARCRRECSGSAEAYLLGLLAMIKCSICSYQCDNGYIFNWIFDCHIYFCQGRFSFELAQVASCVALAPHKAGCSTPFGETSSFMFFL